VSIRRVVSDGRSDTLDKSEKYLRRVKAALWMRTSPRLQVDRPGHFPAGLPKWAYSAPSSSI
jgi:hypothetical protein